MGIGNKKKKKNVTPGRKTKSDLYFTDIRENKKKKNKIFFNSAPRTILICAFDIRAIKL